MPGLFSFKMTPAQANKILMQSEFLKEALKVNFPQYYVDTEYGTNHFRSIDEQLAALTRRNAAAYLENVTLVNELFYNLSLLRHRVKEKAGIFSVAHPADLLQEYRASIEHLLNDSVQSIKEAYQHSWRSDDNNLNLTSQKKQDIKALTAAFKAINNVIDAPIPKHMRELLSIEPKMQKRISAQGNRAMFGGVMCTIGTITIIVGVISLVFNPLVALTIIGFGVATLAEGIAAIKQPGIKFENSVYTMRTKGLPSIDKLFKSKDTSKALKAAQNNMPSHAYYIPRGDPLTNWINNATKPQPSLLAFLH
jgi:hypothetical protein